VVGEPRLKYLWILSRTPTLDKETLDEILSRLPDKGYTLDRLQWTPQVKSE
jgi:apolipoprotein D and lipocalin family protein